MNKTGQEEVKELTNYHIICVAKVKFDVIQSKYSIYPRIKDYSNVLFNNCEKIHGEIKIKEKIFLLA
jgi:hypothetical protein